MHALPADPRRRAAIRVTPRLVFWAFFAMYAVIAAIWAVSSPAMSSPDEPAHAIKAAAVVRGQLGGDETGLPAGSGTVRVPELFRQAASLQSCFAGNALVGAACQQGPTGDLAALTDATTSAARYNPLYYALAGIPSLFTHSLATFVLMRMVGGLLAAWLLALAARTVAELGGGQWPAAALLVAVTPMTVFLTTSINPQSVELPGAILLWIVLMALLRAPAPAGAVASSDDRALLHRRLFRLTLATLFVANVRGLGPLIVAVAVAAALLAGGWRPAWAVLRDRRSWPFVVCCALAVLVGWAWTRRAGTLQLPDQPVWPQYTGDSILSRTTAATNNYLLETIGLFGWRDALLPVWQYVAGGGLVLLVVLLGFAAGRWRQRLAMLAVAALVIALPIYAEYTQARYIGLFWQGRYGLPIAVGVPIIAGFAVHAARDAIDDRISARILGTVGICVAVLQAAALALNMRRYVNGLSEEAPWFTWDAAAWLPPVHPYLLVGACLLYWLGIALLLVRATASAVPPAGPPPQDPTKSRPSDEFSSDPSRSVG